MFCVSFPIFSQSRLIFLVQIMWTSLEMEKCYVDRAFIAVVYEYGQQGEKEK